MRFPRESEIQLEEVVISRDGELAVVAKYIEGVENVSNRDAVGSYVHLELAGKKVARVGVLMSGTVLSIEPRYLGLPADISDADFLVAVTLAAVGEHLDRQGLPPETPPLTPATHIECFTYQFDEWKNRNPEPDSQILQYLRRKAYWSWRLGLRSARITLSDALRLGCSVSTLWDLSILQEGLEWQRGALDAGHFYLEPTAQGLQAESRRLEESSPSAASPLIESLTPARYRAVRAAWVRSQAAAHGPSRNLPEAIREAINAVEGMARIVSGAYTDTLGGIIQKLRSAGRLNPTIARSVEAVWAFTNNTPGIRHGAAKEVEIHNRDARYILESCESAVKLLLDLDTPSGDSG